jgi:RNA polymerase sigma-70 factor, ECF subfamily
MNFNALFKHKQEFEKLTWVFAGQLYRLAYSRLGNQQDAEDIVQEAYLRAFRSFHTLVPNSDTKAWLMKILLNVMNDHYSRNLRVVPTLPMDETAIDSDSPGAVRSPEQELSESEIDPKLLEAVRSLPAILVYPLLLREIEDMTYEEIALVLDIPIGTVMSRLFRARQSLRNKLADKAESERSDEAAADLSRGHHGLKEGS